MDIVERQVVAHTPFCDFVAKTLRGQEGSPPFYTVELADYVGIVAPTSDGQLLLVRQYRPAVEQYTLELPAGCVEPGEDPAVCARRELFEETGYEAGQLEPLGCLIPDSGRLSNRLFCFVALDVVRAASPPPAEAGIEVVSCPLPEVGNWILEGRIHHALHVAALFLAVLRGKLEIQ